MAENATENKGEQGGVTVVVIPDEQKDAVLEFMAGLQSDEEDVSGHMLSRGGMVGGLGGGALSAKLPTDTGCLQSVTGNLGIDITCYDSDTIKT